MAPANCVMNPAVHQSRQDAGGTNEPQQVIRQVRLELYVVTCPLTACRQICAPQRVVRQPGVDSCDTEDEREGIARMRNDLLQNVNRDTRDMSRHHREADEDRLTFRDILLLLWRALLLRCPRCGEGPLYKRGYTMYEACPVCGWRYEREEGYWTGAMAVNLVVAELIVTAVVVPLAAYLAITHQSPAALIFLAPLAVVLPFLLYWHAKSLWMAIDLMLNPVPLRH